MHILVTNRPSAKKDCCVAEACRPWEFQHDMHLQHHDHRTQLQDLGDKMSYTGPHITNILQRGPITAAIMLILTIIFLVQADAVNGYLCPVYSSSMYAYMYYSFNICSQKRQQQLHVVGYDAKLNALLRLPSRTMALNAHPKHCSRPHSPLVNTRPCDLCTSVVTPFAVGTAEIP